MIDYKKLEEGLDKLDGYALEAVEKEERLTGNAATELSLSKSFQARLAAKALGMNVHDLKSLKLKEYNAVCARVFSFLFAPEPATT